MDVFQGIGTLTGDPYHIRLKQYYLPLQHPPHSVPVGKQKAYRAKLDRLLMEDIIANLHENTDWVNSLVPAFKPDDTIRLCLDLKDLKMPSKGTNGIAEPCMTSCQNSHT